MKPAFSPGGLAARTSRRLTVTAALIVAVGAAGCGGDDDADGYDWKAPYDAALVSTQAKEFSTYGLPDDWANYGGVIKAFCAKHNAAGCTHKDTDASSAEIIQRTAAERDKPVGTVSDLGGMWGPVATAKGVVPPYLPPSAKALKETQRSKDGGWVYPFVGTIGFVVNRDKVTNVPRAWADLLKPEYKGKIATKNPASSGTGQNMVISAAYATGGDVADLTPAYQYFRKLKASGNFASASMSEETLEKGEAPIQINYDFNGLAQQRKLKAKGVSVDVVIPRDGSIYSPSALMVNKHNTDEAEFTKAFLDFVLTDEGQKLFAESGARPIRYVNGDLTLPTAVKQNWLPDSAYASTKEVDVTKVDPAAIVRGWEAQVLS